MMPRRRHTSDEEVSLFPFLSIIACVIGVLTMMIATLTLAQTDTQDVAQIEAFEKSQRELKRIDVQIASLREQLQISSSSALQAREDKRKLQITIEELEKLLTEVERIDQELAAQQQVEIVIPPVDPEMQESLDDMRSQYSSLQQQLEQLQSELDNQALNSEAKVRILPQGSGLNFQPYFVECAAGAVVMHHLPVPKRIRAANISKDPDFLALLDRVANGVNDTIVFLIRSDGLGVYNACKRICDPRNIRSGKLPVVGQGRIDLGEFGQATSQNPNTTTPDSKSEPGDRDR